MIIETTWLTVSPDFTDWMTKWHIVFHENDKKYVSIFN